VVDGTSDQIPDESVFHCESQISEPLPRFERDVLFDPSAAGVGERTKEGSGSLVENPKIGGWLVMGYGVGTNNAGRMPSFGFF